MTEEPPGDDAPRRFIYSLRCQERPDAACWLPVGAFRPEAGHFIGDRKAAP